MSYASRFARLKDCAADFVLYGDLLLVEEYAQGTPTLGVTRADGSTVQIILAANTGGRQVGGIDDEKPMLMRVLLVGKALEEYDLAPGAIVEVPKIAVSYRSVWGPVFASKDCRLGLVKHSDVLMSYPTEDAYKRVYAALEERQ